MNKNELIVFEVKNTKPTKTLITLGITALILVSLCITPAAAADDTLHKTLGEIIRDKVADWMGWTSDKSSYGTVESDQIPVTGYEPPAASVTPESADKQTINDKFILQTESGGTYYQWQYKFLNGVEWKNIAGATSSQYIFTPTQIGLSKGQYQFRVQITASGLNFESVTNAITIYSIQPRPMATMTMAPIPTDSITGLTDAFDVEPGQYPDFKQAVKAVVNPIEGDLPDGFLFVIVFGVIFLMLWLITKNTAVPSIIGLIFGGTILALFPASYYGPAIAILAISIAGGIYRVFQPPK